jgi:hypothetical protein
VWSDEAMKQHATYLNAKRTILKYFWEVKKVTIIKLNSMNVKQSMAIAS